MILDNLVSYWKLDESSGNAADSQDSNTLTNNGTVTYAAAKKNNGAVFDHTNGKYLGGSSPTNLNFNSDWSLSIWYNFSVSDNANYGVVSMGAFDTAAHSNYLFSIDPNSAGSTIFSMTISNGSTTNQQTVTRGSAEGTSAWHHLAVVFDNTAKTMTIYRDGSSVGTSSAFSINIANATAHAFALGGYDGDNTGVKNTFNGSLDEGGMWSRKLTAAEVTQIYNSGTGFFFPFAEFTIAETVTGIDGNTMVRGAVFTKTETVTGTDANVMRRGALFTIADIVTGIDTSSFSYRWTRSAKDTSTFANAAKDASAWTNSAKNTSSFTDQPKN